VAKDRLSAPLRIPLDIETPKRAYRRNMAASTHFIEVNAPLRAVYNQWTQFEEFPQFMEGVEEVRQQGEKHLFWRAQIGGKAKEWEAEITNQVPDQRIAWQSVDGSPNSGTITFDKISADRTRVNATIGYEPEGLLEKTGDALGIPSGRIEGDLKRFRDYEGATRSMP
jgi:uncharacterized membrane protein